MFIVYLFLNLCLDIILNFYMVLRGNIFDRELLLEKDVRNIFEWEVKSNFKFFFDGFKSCLNI